MTTSRTRAEENRIGEIRAVVFDADDTLVDYREDATRAFRAALRAVGREEEDVLEACLAFDYGNWDKAGLADVHLPAVQAQYHALYRAHVRDIFDYVEREKGLCGKARIAEEAFWEHFFSEGHPVEGAEEAVEQIKLHCPVYAATNGLMGQHRRLASFRLKGVFTSEELGAIKPTPAFFGAIAEKIGLPPAQIVMVGDSLASDIAGARAAGFSCIFFNRNKIPCPDGVKEIDTLSALYPLLSPRLPSRNA